MTNTIEKCEQKTKNEELIEILESIAKRSLGKKDLLILIQNLPDELFICGEYVSNAG